MTTQQPTTHPWQTPQPAYGKKLLTMLGAAFLLIIALSSFFMLVAMIVALINPRPGPNTTSANLTALAISVVLLLISGFGLYKLLPILRAPTNFTPAYGAIAPETGGYPFEVRFQRSGWGRTFNNKGTVRFDAEGLTVEGWLTPSPLLQIAIIFVLTVVPLVVFQVGLGLLPALLIAYYVGRKKLSLPVHYASVSEPQLRGCQATFRIPTMPGKVVFYTSQSDGERLYREMRQRFPQAG